MEHGPLTATPRAAKQTGRRVAPAPPAAAPVPPADVSAPPSAPVATVPVHVPASRVVVVADQVVVPRLARAPGVSSGPGPSESGTAPLGRDQAIAMKDLRYLRRAEVAASRAPLSPPARRSPAAMGLVAPALVAARHAVVGHLGGVGPVGTEVGRDGPIKARAGPDVPATLTPRRDPAPVVAAAGQVPADPGAAAPADGPGRLPRVGALQTAATVAARAVVAPLAPYGAPTAPTGVGAAA